MTDAIFIDNNCDYLLATDSSNPNGCTTTLYKKGIEYYEPLYKYDMHGNIARNAGAVFWVEGKLVRPAQDCNKGYGKGVVFQTIEQDQIGKVTFSTIDSLYPINSEYDKGLYTFNVYHDLIVIDSYREPNKYLSFVILKIINIMLCIRNVLKI